MRQDGFHPDCRATDAVGIIGSEPKCCKSFLALDLAVAVAAGTPCLRRFAVARPGQVLLYPAKDALHVVRRRHWPRRARRPSDDRAQPAPRSRGRPHASKGNRLKPRLLILDPFVRLHRIDEDVSGDVAPLLAFLRELQRRHATAIAVVHHARKGAGTVRARQALCGSSEFPAWGDFNLYLRRNTDDRIAPTVEHRAAAATAGITLELAQRDDALALRPVRADHQPNRSVQQKSVDQRITSAFADASQPRPFSDLRASCGVRDTTLYERLAAMIAARTIVKSADGYRLAAR